MRCISLNESKRHETDKLVERLDGPSCWTNRVLLKQLLTDGRGNQRDIKYIRLLNHKWQTVHVYNQSTSYTKYGPPAQHAG